MPVDGLTGCLCALDIFYIIEFWRFFVCLLAALVIATPLHSFGQAPAFTGAAITVAIIGAAVGIVWEVIHYRAN